MIKLICEGQNIEVGDNFLKEMFAKVGSLVYANFLDSRNLPDSLYWHLYLILSLFVPFPHSNLHRVSKSKNDYYVMTEHILAIK